MLTSNNTFSLIEHKTRIFIQDYDGVLGRFFQYLNEFLSKELSFFSQDSNLYDSDFVVFSSDNTSDFENFKPNIALIINHENLEIYSKSMVSGGALILPELKIDFEPSHFFRMIEYPIQNFVSKSEASLDTEFGHLDLSHLPIFISKHIFGLQKLAQQMGIMEEDFYEVVSTFQD